MSDAQPNHRREVDRSDAWEPSVEAIDAIFDEDYGRAERALLQSLGQTRKLQAHAQQEDAEEEGSQ